MAAKYGENQIEKKFNTSVECRYVENKKIKDLKNEIEAGVESNNRVVTHCFCMEKLVETKDIEQVRNFNLTINDQPFFACKEWMGLYLISKSLKIGIVVVVPIINIVLSITLNCKKNIKFI